MPTTYTGANITQFGGSDDWVSGAEATSGFTITGSLAYAGTAPAVGSTVTLSIAFNDFSTQTVTATVDAVNTTLSSVSFSVADPGLTIPGGAGTYSAHVSNAGGTGLNTSQSPFHNFTYITCFVRGTRIATPDGSKPVEELAAGDLVLTAAGQSAPVKWIGRRRLNLSAYPRREMAAPVRIARDAFADGMPSADLLISPDHAVLVEGRLICARQLVNGVTIHTDLSCDTVEYLHVELERHDILVAEGLTVESYLNTGNRGFFGNAGDPLVLRPDLSDETDLPGREAASCMPFASGAESVRPIWERLAARAATLGARATPADTTLDPDLRIVAGSKTVTPIHAAENLYIFVLPKGVTEVLIRSRATAPSAVRPWVDDRRVLGVGVQRIIVRSADDFQEIPVDSPNLGAGWWQPESDGRGLWRWTDGAGVLSVPLLNGPRMLELRIVPADMGYLAATEEQTRAVA